MNCPKIPILRGVLSPSGKQIAVFCPYCDDWHVHCWGGTERKEHRWPHCTNPSSGFIGTGYNIAPFRKKDAVRGLSNFWS